jgi:hypothetical protein
MKAVLKKPTINISIPKIPINNLLGILDKYAIPAISVFLIFLSVFNFHLYLENGLGLAYNDARSHLDIGRRVVEGLKTGLAQLGSVWLPLNHLLMVPTIWNDWWWHSGLSGAIQNMASFIGTGILIYQTLKRLGTGILARFIGVAVFALNINILYLQSTAMTELLLLFTMTAGCYYLILWAQEDKLIDLVKSAFWIMMATLTRYDGWFLLAFATAIVAINTFVKKGYAETEGKVILFTTLGGFGIFLWFLWNLVIFKDPLYFAFGPYSAHSQQLQLEQANNLPTKHNLLLSTQIYLYALFYNSYTIPAIIALAGFLYFLRDKLIPFEVKTASISLTAPLFFNITALFLGFSVLFIQGISGNTWFNVRYGVMLAPTIAIFIGYLVDRAKDFRIPIISVLSFVILFAFLNNDAVTIDDARVGASQKNVTEVAGWLNKNTQNKEGFILISAASHDAIIFSSGLPMSKFIHEGTGVYWESATTSPERWARWIVLRTYDDNDSTYRLIKDTKGFKLYRLVDSYPFADIYELPDEYLENLNTKPIFSKSKHKSF